VEKVAPRLPVDGFHELSSSGALDRMLNERGMPLELVLALDVSNRNWSIDAARGRPDDDRETIASDSAIPSMGGALLDYYRRKGYCGN